MPSGQITFLTWHIPGTLAADISIRHTLPFDAQLVHVSAVGSNTAAAGLEIGIGSSAAAYMAKKSIGVSGTPVEFDLDDFTTWTGKAYPRLAKGGILAFALDYDYNAGGGALASANVTIVAELLIG